ncbi:biotin/lipoyl-binding protein, partial [Pseudomonas nitroreducens]|uniref:biotin/lipoyl-binding protein n=1 Tax=Pseudomonas nitroreducens TaxID=46680 RepID=UPI0011315252
TDVRQAKEEQQVKRTEQTAHADRARAELEGETEKGPRNPAKAVALAVVALLVALVAWYGMADRWTPYSGSGSMAAYVAQIAPRVSGPVVGVMVVDNSHVKAGEPLARIDSAPYELEVKQAEAALAQA